MLQIPNKWIALLLALLLGLSPVQSVLAAFAQATAVTVVTAADEASGCARFTPMNHPREAARSTPSSGCGEDMAGQAKCAACAASHCGACLASLPAAHGAGFALQSEANTVFPVVSIHLSDSPSMPYRPPRA